MKKTHLLNLILMIGLSLNIQFSYAIDDIKNSQCSTINVANEKIALNSDKNVKILNAFNDTTFSSDIADWKLYVDSESHVGQFFNQPAGIWLKGSDNDLAVVSNAIHNSVKAAPLFVTYFIPTKNSYKPDQNKINDYIIRNINIAKTIGNQRAIIIIEPDLLCLSLNTPGLLTVNQQIITEVVKNYKTFSPNARIYIDAGHSNWHQAYKVAWMLKGAGIDKADGFATNVSNFQFTDNELNYAGTLSKLLNGKRFVIDTSRNGNGPGKERNNAHEWSDPIGIKVGYRPTTLVTHKGLDAFLWVKPPGEADGTAFPAGSWHPELLD
ncbi:MAG: glycoside hydrolase family 6 protein [Cyanobacteriota bacterium]